MEVLLTKSTLGNGVEISRPEGSKIRRTWLSRHLLADLFQWGPQCRDLREPLRRIKRVYGSGVTQAYYFLLVRNSLLSSESYLK